MALSTFLSYSESAPKDTEIGVFHRKFDNFIIATYLQLSQQGECFCMEMICIADIPQKHLENFWSICITDNSIVKVIYQRATR